VEKPLVFAPAVELSFSRAFLPDLKLSWCLYNIQPEHPAILPAFLKSIPVFVSYISKFFHPAKSFVQFLLYIWLLGR
jgi:hypothetical protein